MHIFYLLSHVSRKSFESNYHLQIAFIREINVFQIFYYKCRRNYSKTSNIKELA